MRTTILRFTLAAGALATLLQACGESTKQPPPAQGASGSSAGSLAAPGGGAGTSGTGGGAGTSGTAHGGAGMGSAGSATSGGSGQAGAGFGGAVGGAAAAAGVAPGGTNGEAGAGPSGCTERPKSLFVMFDRSESMLDEVSDGVTSWDLGSSGFLDFVASAGSPPVSVALRFYPHDLPAPGCTGDMLNGCDPNACSMMLVDLGSLDAAAGPTDEQEQALVSAFALATPETSSSSALPPGTPISVALQGAVYRATQYQASAPGARASVVLVGDGEPVGCVEDIDYIASLAAAGLTSGGVHTYTLALPGADVDQMDAIARAGGTERAFAVAANAEARDVTAAFEAIVLDEQDCQ